MRVHEILSRKGDRVVTIRSDATVAETAAVLKTEYVGALVVTDADSRLAGIVSERDIVHGLVGAGAAYFSTPIGNLASSDVQTCDSEDDIETARALMATHRIRHLPVVSNEALVGIVSMRDIEDQEIEILASENSDLRESDESYRRFLDGCPYAIYVQVAGSVVYANARAAELFGTSGPDQLIGLSSLSLFHPACHEHVQERRKHTSTVGTSQSMAEFRHMRLDGGEFFGEAAGTPITWNGQDAVLVLVRDVTDRKRSEIVDRRLAAIVESSADVIIATTTGGIITDWNAAAEDAYGYTAEEAVGQPVALICADEMLPECMENTKAACRGEAIEGYETVRRHKNGTLIDVSMSISPIKDAAGNIIGLSSIHRVITEQKRAAETLREAILAAEAANRAKSEFLANMSHELRTPLNGIIGFSELMKNEVHGPLGESEYMTYVNHSNEAGHHLLSLIDDILDLSRVEAGKEELVFEPVDLVETLAHCTSVVGTQALNASIKIIRDLPNDLPRLNADKRKLKQVVLSLLSNAVKFTPSGGTVTIKAWARPDSGYVIQIVDTGIGIALEDIPRAMAPFGQIDSKLSRKYEGTGLGIPLAKSFVEMHGGSLDLQSEIGIGTTVTIRFPAERLLGGPCRPRTQAA